MLAVAVMAVQDETETHVLTTRFLVFLATLVILVAAVVAAVVA